MTELFGGAPLTTGPGPLALLMLAAALFAWPSARDLVTRRARPLRSPAARRRGSPARSLGGVAQGRRRFPRSAAPGGPARRWLLAAAAGGALGVLIGGLPGLVSAAVVAAAVGRLPLRLPDGGRQRRDEVLRELPVACDLLAACLSAGVPLAPAVAGVGAAVIGPLGESLAVAAGLLRLGAEPRTAWADAPADAVPLARLLARAAESGAAVSGALHALAADSRTSARGRAEAAVRRAGVWVLAPLGVCFLPAFLCLGVIPLVLGIATDVFG